MNTGWPHFPKRTKLPQEEAQENSLYRTTIMGILKCVKALKSFKVEWYKCIFILSWGDSTVQKEFALHVSNIGSIPDTPIFLEHHQE